MKLVSKSALAALATLAFATAASGEEVKATKVSPIKAALPDSYGKLQMRHYANFNMEKDEVYSTIPKAQLRAYLGSKFFDGKLDTQLILAGTKATETTKISNRRPEIYTSLNAFSNDYVSIDPYLDVYVPYQGSGTDGTLSLDVTAMIPTIQTAAGGLDLSIGLDPNASLSSREEKTANVDVKTDRQASFLTTSESGAPEVKKKEPSYNAEARASIGFKPAIVKGLGLTATSYVNRSFEPKYEVVEEGNDTVQTRVGYTTENITRQSLVVSYKVNDSLSLANETWHKMNGAYAARYDGPAGSDGLSRVTNIVKLTYTLF